MKKKTASKLWERKGFDGTPYQMAIRKIASMLTRIILKTAITPNQITLFATLLYIVPAYLFYVDNLWLNLIGILVIYLINILDKVDGQVARTKNLRSKRGIFIDGILHNVGIVAIHLPLGLRYFFGEQNIWALLAAVSATVFLYMQGYNHLHRAYLVGSVPDNEDNKLKIRSPLREQRTLIRLYSIPNQNFPEILALCFILGIVPFMLYAYAVYHAVTFFVSAVLFSRFNE